MASGTNEQESDQAIISAFFLKKDDAKTMSDGRRRRSVLLALQDDISFAVHLPGRWRSLQLDKPQIVALEAILPSFAVISLFCTGIDVLARAEKKRQPPRGQNGIYFTSFLKRYLGLSVEEVKQLWQLRNGISHGYALPHSHATKKNGSVAIIERNSKGYWTVYLNAMHSTLGHLSRELHKKLFQERALEVQETAKYLQSNGFFFTR